LIEPSVSRRSGGGTSMKFHRGWIVRRRPAARCDGEVTVLAAEKV
jgi:hypothetical protein